MTTFNEKLTIEEATELVKFKGTVNYPKTSHNIKMMTLVVLNQLKKLQTK